MTYASARNLSQSLSFSPLSSFFLRLLPIGGVMDTCEQNQKTWAFLSLFVLTLFQVLLCSTCCHITPLWCLNMMIKRVSYIKPFVYNKIDAYWLQHDLSFFIEITYSLACPIIDENDSENEVFDSFINQKYDNYKSDLLHRESRRVRRSLFLVFIL